MRQYNDTYYYINPEIKFKYSSNLSERPVNLVIKKRLPNEIADSTFIIEPSRVIRNGAVIYETP